MDKKTFLRYRKIYNEIFDGDLNRFTKKTLVKKVGEFRELLISYDYLHKDGDKYNHELNKTNDSKQ